MNYEHVELIPHAYSDRTFASSDQFYQSLHELSKRAPKKLRRIKLRIISTKDGGVRFVVSLPSALRQSFEQLTAAYFPQIVLRDFSLSMPERPVYEQHFRAVQADVVPLRTFESSEESDPLSYVVSALGRLDSGETCELRINLQPARASKTRRANSLIHKPGTTARELRASRVLRFGELFGRLLFSIADLVRLGFEPSASYSAKNSVSKEVGTPYDAVLDNKLHKKVRASLFEASLVISVRSADKVASQKRQHLLSTALSLQSADSPQKLVPTKRKQRAPLLLSASEVAMLFHMPRPTTAVGDGHSRSLARSLAVPPYMHGEPDFDVHYGVNIHHGISTPIGLTAAERERHVYIIGGTGNGKTTLIQAALVEDIQRGKGVALIDPHGDLALGVLKRIPEDRLDDVIYINPDDLTQPVAINLLELPKGLSGDELLKEKDRICETTISVLRKQFSEDDSGGHRIEYVLRNSIQTALHVEGATLFTVYRLLTDTAYQRSVVAGIEDQDLRNFWRNEIGRAGDYQRVKMSAGITTKIGRFLFSASARTMMDHATSSIDFDDVLATNKIIICNFSKGLLGEDTSSLMGTMVLAKLQIASLRRARLPSSERSAFHVYVDEFQNFATTSFVQMLSEARKYRLFVTMAEQSMAQQESARLSTILLANAGTVICFRTGSPEDERLLLPLLSPWIVQGELTNLPSFCFYMRLAATVPREPFSGTTIAPTEPEVDMSARVLATSRRLYGRAVVRRPEGGVPEKQKPRKILPFSADPLAGKAT